MKCESEQFSPQFSPAQAEILKYCFKEIHFPVIENRETH